MQATTDPGRLSRKKPESGVHFPRESRDSSRSARLARRVVESARGPSRRGPGARRRRRSLRDRLPHLVGRQARGLSAGDGARVRRPRRGGRTPPGARGARRSCRRRAHLALRDGPRRPGWEPEPALASDLGAEATHALADGSVEAAARVFSGREGVDCVIETAGTAEAVHHALMLVRPGGRVVLTGLPHEPTPVEFFFVVRREVTIVGSMIYQDEFGEAMRLVADGTVKTRPLVTHHFALDTISDAFVAHAQPGSIKVTVVI